MANVVFIFLEDLEIHRFVVVCIGNDIFLIITVVSTDMRTNKHTYTHSVTACNFTNFFFATSGENQLTSGGKSSRNWHCNAYMIYSVTLSSRVCLSIKFCFVDFCPLVFFFRQIFKSEGIFSFFSSFFKWVLRGVVWKTFFWSRSIKKRIKGRWSTLCLFGFQFSTLGVGFFQLLVNFPQWEWNFSNFW